MKALTTKQRHLLKLVVAGNINAAGARVSNIDYTQVLTRLPYRTSRDSLMCSVRILVDQGWIIRGGKELRDGRMKQTLIPSATAVRLLSPAPVAPAPAVSASKPSSVPGYIDLDLDSDIMDLILE